MLPHNSSKETLSLIINVLLVITDIRVERVFHYNEDGFRFSESEGENLIKIPSGNLQNNGLYTGSILNVSQLSLIASS